MFRNLLRHTFSRQGGATIFRVQVHLRHGRRSGSVNKMKSPLVTSYPSDVGFTSSVKAIQSRKGSRQGYTSIEERGSWETRITPDLAEFIGRQTYWPGTRTARSISRSALKRW